MMSDMVNFWTKSAAYFANYSSVIGYELINEPWAGDIYAVSRHLEPGAVLALCGIY
jgi:aryl-phospho-beta-D-glucosidase BglC (GH1 family)